MKNYFARLAGRATQMPVAPSVRAAAAGDPFDAVAPLEAPVAPQPPIHDAPRAPLQAPAPAIVPRDVAPPRPMPPAAPAPPEIRPPATERAVEDVWPLTPHSEKGPEPRPVTVVAETQSLQPPPLEPPPPPPIVSTRVERPAETPSAEPRPAAEEPPRDELQLLRTADAFMRQFLDHRTSREVRDEVPREPRDAPEPRAANDPAPRLQPPSVPSPIVEPQPEPPSLVIGNITVEVLPSAPPPASPARSQIVVVRGAGPRRSGFLSSRRFGLGQS